MNPSSRESSPSGKKMRYLTFAERYFTPLYKLNSPEKSLESENGDESEPKETTQTKFKEPSPVNALASVNSSGPNIAPQDHVKILLHSNGICVLTLAPSHPILTKRLKAKTIDFQVSKKVNRLQNAVRGKGKKGGQFFADDKQTVAFVSCDDGSRYALRNGVRGALMEVNERLVDQPDLLTSDPFGQGFLAIILPRKGERDAKTLNLVTEAEYLAAMKTEDVVT